MKRIQFDLIGGDWIDPPILMPAIRPLELSGEAIRSRLLTSADSAGEELALRPDLTLAVVNQHMESGAKGPVSYRYFGKAFRQPVLEGEPREFYQTGFECFGYTDGPKRDILTLSAVGEAIAKAGLTSVSLSLGDISVFDGVVKSLNLSPFWTHQLLRAFRRKEGIRNLLNQDKMISHRSVLSQTLSGLPAARAEALLDEVLSLSGGQVTGGRTREDILRRLRLQAEARAEGPLDPRARQLLAELMGLEGRPEEVLDRLNSLVQSAGIHVQDTLDRFSDLVRQLSAGGIPFRDRAFFSVQFGRQFDYYDGLVFELSHSSLGPRRPVAAGGRYDGLFSRLSQGRLDLTAVGGVVRPDRIAFAQAAEGVTA